MITTEYFGIEPTLVTLLGEENYLGGKRMRAVRARRKKKRAARDARKEREREAKTVAKIKGYQQSTEEQPIEEQNDEQSTEEQSTEEQSTEEQSTGDQAMEGLGFDMSSGNLLVLGIIGVTVWLIKTKKIKL
jgi:hypothetical protein